MAKKLRGCPGWLELSPDRESFIFMPDRAEVVHKIFEASIAGLGGYTIAKVFNERRVPPFGPSSKWDQSTIHNLLRNRATVGEHQPKRIVKGKRIPVGEPISGFYPAVIDEATFAAAQASRQKNLADGRGRKGNYRANLFEGLLTCAYCANPVRFRRNGADRSLKCSTVLNGGACYRMAWSYADFEKSFFGFIEKQAPSALANSAELTEVVDRIRKLLGSNTYDTRLTITLLIKALISKIKVAPAGDRPTISELSEIDRAALKVGRIKRNGVERHFEIIIPKSSQRAFVITPIID